jgi:hypothetical protein
MLCVPVPLSAKPGTTTRQWTFRDPAGVLVSRAVCLTVTDVPVRPARRAAGRKAEIPSPRPLLAPREGGARTLTPAPTPLITGRGGIAASQPAESNRYLATLADYLAGVRSTDNFGKRLLAERLDRLVNGAAAWYSRQPTRPLDALLDADSQTPLKLRWLAVRAIRQLIDAHVTVK